MSTMKHEMPSCFGASGFVRARQMPQSASLAIDVQTFWPFSTQPPSTRVAARRQRGEVGARAGLAEQLAPTDLAAQRRHDPAFALLLGAVHDQVRQRPHRRRRCSARVTLAARNSSSITSSSSALASRPHGCGPARRDVARLGDPVALLLRRQVLDLGEERAQLGAVRVDLGCRRGRSTARRRRAPSIAACAARTRQSSGVPVSWCSVIARRRYMCASCSHVKPMPPSVCTQSLALANAASNASAAAAAIASAAPGSVEVVGGARRVPHRGAGELDARQHLGAAVLHALELADRPAELHAHLRVLGRGVDAPLRDADRLGREQHGREQAHRRRRVEVRELAVGRAAAAAAARASMRASRRVRSTLLTSVARRRPRRRARTTRRRPRQTITSATGAAARRASRRRARPRRSAHRRRCAAAARRGRAAVGRSNAATIAVGTYGPGAHARPSSSTTTACSSSPRRSRRGPRRCAARSSPARPARPRRRAASPSRRRARADDARARCGRRRTAGRPAQVLVFLGDPDRHAADSRHDRLTTSRQVESRRPATDGQTIFSPSRTIVIAWVGHPCAASTILSSGCAVGSSDDRDAVVVEVEHARRPERRSCPSPCTRRG